MKKFTFAVLSALLLLLLGCRTELEPVLEQTTEPPAFTIIHNNAGLLENNPLLSGKISKAGALSKSSSKSSLDDYTVYPDRVTYVSREGSGRESYAFYIERKGAKSDYIVENLVFSRNKTDQDYSVFRVTYFLPKGIHTDSKDIRVEKMEKLSSTDFSSIFPKNNTASKGGGGCTVEFIIEETLHKCYSGEHEGAEEAFKCDGKGSLPYSTYVVVGMYDGCNGPAGGGPPTSPEGGESGNPNPGSGSGNNLPVDTGISLPPSCQTGNCGETIVANDINLLLDKRLNYENLLWLHQNPQQADAIYQALQNNTQAFIKEFYIWGVGFLSEGNAYADFIATKDFTFSFQQNNPNVTWSHFERIFLTPKVGNDGGDDFNINNYSTYQPQQYGLPKFSLVNSNYPRDPNNLVYGMPSNQVYQLVGGQLYNSHKANPSSYNNACAIRISRALNYSGQPIPVFINNLGKQKSEKGGDNLNYILTAEAMLAYMLKTYPAPTYQYSGSDLKNVYDNIKGKNGIYIIIPNVRSELGASGHADIFYTNDCLTGGCHLGLASGGSVYFWQLFN